MIKKGLLFDFNGTMFFDSPKHKMAWDKFSLEYRKKHIQDVELDLMHGRNNKQILEMLLGNVLTDEESDILSKKKEAYYRACCLCDKEFMHLAPGLMELLDKLKELEVPMTICTASIKDNVDFFITSFHLDKWFTIQDIVYDDGSHADKTSMFIEGSKRIKVPLENCMIIEDSFSGIRYANEVHAGKVIAITTHEKEKVYQEMSGVDEIIFDYYDFDTSYFIN